MRKFLSVALVLSAGVTMPVAAEAVVLKMSAYRHYSKAQFVSIGNRVCGPHGNPRNCCIFNGGVWQTIPKPHCVLM